MAAARRDHLQPAARARRTVARSMRYMHAVPRGVPDRGIRRAARARRDQVRVIPHDRISRLDSRRAARGIGNHIFGCDVCQEVCPWNASPVRRRRSVVVVAQDLNVAALIDLWRRTDEELAEFIGDTAMTRAGVNGLRRNLAVALGNSGDERALAALDDTAADATKSIHSSSSTSMGEAEAYDALVILTFVMMYSSTTPRRVAFELIARRAGILVAPQPGRLHLSLSSYTPRSRAPSSCSPPRGSRASRV